MKYYSLNTSTDWQVAYAHMGSQEYKEGMNMSKINNREFDEAAPIVPCKLVHMHEDYRDIINWEAEGMERPPLEPPLLKDVIQRSGMLSMEGVGGVVVSKKIKEALEKYGVDKHFLYKLQLEYKKEYYDYYFLVPNLQEPYEHIDFAKTEFMTRPKLKYSVSKTKKEVIKPSEAVKVQDLDEFLKIRDKLKSYVYNNKVLYINKKLDFFLNGGSTFYVSERFKNYIEKEGLEVTFLELNSGTEMSAIIAPEDV